ncbi:MAG: DUF4139 domain-containing protein [Myxococcales bacterium]|nr:DUF4139 domain-containing protein [Myxococcales bacterium]
MCWNATGEDWSEVSVVLSTARPGDQAEPPSLTDDLVSVQPRFDVVVEESEEVAVARPLGVRATTSLPGIDDGGTPFRHALSEPLDLPSDGRPVAVVLGEWEGDAVLGLRSVPEQSPTAIVRSEQTNTSGQPLLAGPVELVRDGTAVGRSQIRLVRPEASFGLGWGSDDAIQIVRRRAHEVERTKATGRQTHTFRIEMSVRNSGEEARSLELRERVPVSEIKDISVSDAEVLPAAETDDEGFCTWSLELQPGDARTLEVSYVVRASGRVQLPFHGP